MLKEEKGAFSLKEYVNSEELFKKYTDAYNEIMQPLEIESENKITNKKQLLIGGYKKFSSQLRTNSVSDIRWQTAVLFQIGVDLAAEGELTPGQIEIINKAHQHVLAIIHKIKAIPTSKRATVLEGVGATLFGLMMLSMIWWGLETDRHVRNNKLYIAAGIAVIMACFLSCVASRNPTREGLESIYHDLKKEIKELSKTIPPFILIPLIDEKFKTDYKQIISDLNQQTVSTPLRVEREFEQIFKAIQRVYSGENEECKICYNDFKLSDAFYSCVKTKSVNDWPHHGFYHQGCFETWVDNRFENGYKLIDPVSHGELVLKFGLPLLIPIQKVQDDFSRLQREYPLKPGYELTLTDQKLSLRPTQNDIESGLRSTSVDDEEKPQEIRQRPSIFNKITTLASTTILSGLGIKLNGGN